MNTTLFRRLCLLATLIALSVVVLGAWMRLGDAGLNRVVFAQSLRSDFRINAVDSAKAALEIFEQQEVAVLVTDIRMPEMDGLELLRMVKQQSPQTIRMVITAFSDIDPILRAINEGLVARYIVKPGQRDELSQVLRWASELWTFGKDSAELLRRMLEMERLASLGGLTALYVHDLKTPLMMVNVTLDELRAVAEAVPALHAAIDQAPIDPRVKARLLERVDTTPELIDDAKQAATTIQGMLGVLWEFIKPGTGRGEAPVIDPLPIIQHTLSMYQRVTEHALAQIAYRGHKHLPRV